MLKTNTSSSLVKVFIGQSKRKYSYIRAYRDAVIPFYMVDKVNQSPSGKKPSLLAISDCSLMGKEGAIWQSSDSAFYVIINDRTVTTLGYHFSNHYLKSGMKLSRKRRKKNLNPPSTEKVDILMWRNKQNMLLTRYLGYSKSHRAFVENAAFAV